MPEIQFTKENLLERKQLKSGWRELKVKSVSEGPGKNDPDSTVWPIIFIIDDGEDLGVPVNHWFTEKQMGRLSEFIACFTNGQVDVNKKYKLEDTIGRNIQGYVEYDIKTGFNSIKGFQTLKKGGEKCLRIQTYVEVFLKLRLNFWQLRRSLKFVQHLNLPFSISGPEEITEKTDSPVEDENEELKDEEVVNL